MLYKKEVSRISIQQLVSVQEALMRLYLSQLKNFNTTACVGSSRVVAYAKVHLSDFNTTACVGSRLFFRDSFKQFIYFNTTACVGSSQEN